MNDADRPAGIPNRWLALLLVLLGAIAYATLPGAGWIWDDDSYVTRNPVLVEADGLSRIWTPGGTPQFYPLVFMSFWIEARVYGEDFVANPLGFHLVNWALHLGSSILLWRILLVLRVRGAWLAAALFLVHPMQVESVAWVSERKNVLAVFLALAALRAWIAYGAAPKGERVGWYLLSLILFTAAMLSKTMVAVFAPALIALHVWRRLPWSWRDGFAILPFFAVGVPLGLVTAWLEKTWVGANGAEFHLSLLDRLALAPRSALWYVWTWVWPSNIAFVYERWEVDASAPLQWIPAAIALVGAIAFVLLWRRGARGPAVLAAIFLGAVFPALGFLNVYPFLFSYVADHFAYVGSLALATASGYVLATLGRRMKGTIAVAGGAALLVALAAMSAAHTTAYADEETLWRRTLATNPNAWMPASNLAGKLLVRAGEAGKRGDEAEARRLAIEAEAFARTASEHAPQSFTVWMKLSEALRIQGRLDEALVAARESLRRDARIPDLHWIEGRLLELLGRKEEAVEPYRLGATLPDPIRGELIEVSQVKTRRSDYARLLALLGRHAEAGAAWRSAAAVDPEDPLPHGNAGLAYERAGAFADAAIAFDQAISRLDPKARPADGALKMQLTPRLINALLSAPRSDEDLTFALNAARWLVGVTNRSDPLALLFLARAERANGLPEARATFEEAERGAANELLPKELRDEVARHKPTFAGP